MVRVVGVHALDGSLYKSFFFIFFLLGFILIYPALRRICKTWGIT
jgi:hypothetical protein